MVRQINRCFDSFMEYWEKKHVHLRPWMGPYYIFKVTAVMRSECPRWKWLSHPQNEPLMFQWHASLCHSKTYSAVNVGLSPHFTGRVCCEQLQRRPQCSSQAENWRLPRAASDDFPTCREPSGDPQRTGTLKHLTWHPKELNLHDAHYLFPLVGSAPSGQWA